MGTTTGTLGMSPTGSPQDVIVDTDTGAVVVTTDLHNGLHQGVIFSHTYTASGSSSGAFFLYSGAGESHVWIDGLATGGPNVTLRFYEASGTSSGMSSSGFSASAGMMNRKRTSSSASNCRIMTGSGTFASASATDIGSRYVGGGTGVGGTGTGSAIGGEEEWYLKPSTFYAWKYELAVEQNVSLRISTRDY